MSVASRIAFSAVDTEMLAGTYIAGIMTEAAM
jgi:hypothetical protein